MIREPQDFWINSVAASVYLARPVCLMFSVTVALSPRPQLPLCDHTEGLQQRRRGDSCVRERHHQTAVGYELHTNLHPAHTQKSD